MVALCPPCGGGAGEYLWLVLGEAVTGSDVQAGRLQGRYPRLDVGDLERNDNNNNNKTPSVVLATV